MITTITGTQPQQKLGQLVDTAIATQFLSRVVPTLARDSGLKRRADNALDICLGKLQLSQNADGSWSSTGGWATVLQSSYACSALEICQVIGKPVDAETLGKARDYQKGNFDAKSGETKTESSAGVALYALSSSQRANAADASAAKEIIESAKGNGRLPAEATVTNGNLETAGISTDKAARLTAAFGDFQQQVGQVNSDKVLAGFGSNGGEEFLSYTQTSESLVIVGGDDWTQWNDKMHARLEKIQSPDGSWTGHHCITSPVFCTAAVVQCLTTDRDAPVLLAVSRRAAKESLKSRETAKSDSKPVDGTSK
jgi:hypothetical protein